MDRVNPIILKSIQFYFHLGLSYKEIALLSVNHDTIIAERTFKRILRRFGLFRRKYFTDLPEIIHFITEQIQNHGRLHGYRWMHIKCLQNNFVVPQDTVRLILNMVDPFGVDIRSRKRLFRRQYYNEGPNWLWHIDSYDKLKPYGIAINRCIDGFSRCILWLNAGKTASNPKVIGDYYMEAVKCHLGCPITVRSDMGTENVLVKDIQYMLRDSSSITNSRPCFMYGRSTANQRIESWWSILRKHQSQFWLNYFSKLKDDGLFDGHDLDKALIQFCFMKLIQKELDVIVQEWNAHRISSTKNSITPKGRPLMMYGCPELYGTQDYLVPVSNGNIEFCNQLCIFRNNIACCENTYELCKITMEEESLDFGKDPYSCVNLYVKLRNSIKPLFE